MKASDMVFDNFAFSFSQVVCAKPSDLSPLSHPLTTIGINFSVYRGSTATCYGWAVTSQPLTFPPAVPPSTCCQVALEESSKWFPAPGKLQSHPLPLPILSTECATGWYKWRRVLIGLNDLGGIQVHSGWGQGGEVPRDAQGCGQTLRPQKYPWKDR